MIAEDWKVKAMKGITRKIAMAAVLTALVCISTMIVKIPSPLKGYINLGDCMVLLSGWLLPPVYGFLAAGLGSGLADLFSGYGVYAPATFLIKGIMALIAYGWIHILSKKGNPTFAKVMGGLLAEGFMILGYFLFEGILYGFSPSLVNIPANGVQGAVGLLIGIFLIRIIDGKIIKKL